MGRQGDAHGLGMLLPQPRAALDVREQDVERAFADDDLGDTLAAEAGRADMGLLYDWDEP